jgi:hypothetical protein
LQYHLALEDLETRELLTFVTGTAGGNSAIGRLCGQFARNAKNGLPIIRLAAGSYKHRSYGRVEVPDFPVIGWTGVLVTGDMVPVAEDVAPLVAAATATRGDMDDEIPF